MAAGENASALNPIIEVSDYSYPGGWRAANSNERARHYCERLELGSILLFRGIPFDLSREEIDYLVAQRTANTRFHKNISYRPAQDALRGFAADDENRGRVHTFMRTYSERVSRFVSEFLAPYAGKWQVDYASFRPQEEAGRDLPLHKRNDLLHVDAFPSRPSRGGRILRVFTNINPEQPRVWMTGEPFQQLAPKYARAAGLERIAQSSHSPMAHALRSAKRALRAIGVKTPDHSPYDRFMLRFHDWLKENSEYQANGVKTRSEFAPFTTWLILTDTVPHAVLSGRYALEQTYIIPPDALVVPEQAPIHVLERLCGATLA
jgi:hypothetical protein